LILAGLCSGLVACAHVVGPATETAVDATLRGVNRAENRQRVEELLTSEQYLRSSRALAKVIVDAMLAGLMAADQDGRIKALSTGFVRDLGPALGTLFDDTVLPRVEAAVAASVETVLDRALSQATQRRTAEFAVGVARQGLDEVGPKISKTIADGVSQAVRTNLERDLAPALRSVLQ
jgi:hypothetical protein